MMSPEQEGTLYSSNQGFYESDFKNLRALRNVSSDHTSGWRGIPLFARDYSKDEEDYLWPYASRQEFLQSYTFSRKQTVKTKVKDSLRRLKAVVWAVMACNHNPSTTSRKL
ncbi:hypothetical protein O6H91_23G006400 [Diphasiastrum complanatum]|uniref:Uncharacterized protein n=1 Tax=Diphasiastrum complanatum TaxID=34168 RepID=A0ACC2A9K4_DIPCM|nr:hypothetical protein O6H91_23G006400 [Diphasiastrum complanatum]